jgi:putative transposase
MGRLARVVAADVPHHLTQRGNGRRFVLDCDADRSVYLKLLTGDLALCKVSLIGYCLMSNHHLIAIPRTADGLRYALAVTFRKGCDLDGTCGERSLSEDSRAPQQA